MNGFCESSSPSSTLVGRERTWAVIDAVQRVAEARGVAMAEVALAWVTDRPGVTATILGARTTGQLRTNLGASDLRLSAAETAALPIRTNGDIVEQQVVGPRQQYDQRYPGQREAEGGAEARQCGASCSRHFPGV